MRKLFIILFLTVFCFSLEAKADYWQDVEFHGSGKTYKLSDFKGKTVLLMFWATWCPYCKQQMPALSILKKLHANLDNFEIIPVSIDDTGEDDIKNYMQSTNISNLGVYNDPNSDLLHAFGFEAIPVLVLISKDGVILNSYSGLQDLDIKYLDNVIGR